MVPQGFPERSVKAIMASAWYACSREYLKFVSDYSAALYGHPNPDIAGAINSALSTGFCSGSATQKECHLGECIKRRFPSMERVGFCNSGTEANTYTLATAMEFTDRKKVGTDSARGYS
jgi:glutamate-1-semialdehyde 2,1-aminomutase